MPCTGCQILFINGLRCHELGCREAWRDSPGECFECGAEFTRESNAQRFCSPDCAETVTGERNSDEVGVYIPT